MSFRLKTILGIALIQTMVVGVLIWSNVGTLKTHSQREVERRTDTAALLLHAAARDAIIASDLATLESLARELLTLPDVRYIRILNSSGQVLTEAGRPQNTADTFAADNDIEYVADGIYDSVAIVEVAGVEFGRIQMGIDIGLYQAALTRTKQNSYSLAGAGIVLVALFSFLLGTYLTKQIGALQLGARKIGAGDLGHQIPVIGNDELASTARTFNEMSSQLRLQSAMNKAILDSAIDSIICLDGQGTIVDCNPPAVALLGRPLNALTGQRLVDVVQTPVSLDPRSPEFPGLGTRLESTIEIDAAVALPVELVVKKTDEIDGAAYYVVYLSDISDRKQAQKLKDEFVSTVSHELRTPLTAIQGALMLLASRALPADGEQAQKMLDTALNNTKRLADLVNDILDIQKIESGQMKYNFAEHSLIEIIRQAIDHLRPYLEKMSVKLKLTITANPSVRIDSARITQVMTNLISNAAKFSPQNSEISVIVHSVRGRIRVSVIDRGCGVPEEFRSRIFEKFTQADGAANRRYAGTGLGLAICKNIIEAHDGNISFHTAEENGTEFYFDLPVAKTLERPRAQLETA